MLELRSVDASYGKFRALWGISMEVKEGEFVSLLGPNGAGKTTTLRTVIGILRPNSGDVVFKGRKVNDMPVHRRVEMGMAIVPEERAIFPYMTVEENLMVGAQLKRAWDRRFDSLEFVFSLFPRLKERRNQLAGTMSGGEQQMLNIGRALMSKPEFLMLDEPSLGLAPKLVEAVFDAIGKIKEEGITVLLTEQQVVKALEVSDRAYVMENGRMVMEGLAEELLTNPAIKEKYLGL